MKKKVHTNYTSVTVRPDRGANVITFATLGGKARACLHPNALITEPFDFISLHLEVWAEGDTGPPDTWAGHLSPELAEQIVEALDAALTGIKKRGEAA